MPGLQTLLIAYVGMRISDRQARTSADKLKLDLFDRRWAVYVELQNALVALEQTQPIEVSEFVEKTEVAEFLCGPDIAKLADEISEKITSASHQSEASSIWASSKRATVSELFRRYFDFSNVR